MMLVQRMDQMRVVEEGICVALCRGRWRNGVGAETGNEPDP